jgi:hypothetical protein
MTERRTRQQQIPCGNDKEKGEGRRNGGIVVLVVIPEGDLLLVRRAVSIASTKQSRQAYFCVIGSKVFS